MKFVMATIGSAGDVHPFIGLGAALKARGHEVFLATNNYFADIIEQSGIRFIELGDRDDFDAATQNPDLWHPRKGFKSVASFGVLPTLRPLVEIVRAHFEPGQTVAVGSSLALGARIASEAFGVPMATVHLAPVLFRSNHAMPKLPGTMLPDAAPKFLKRLFWRIADAVIIDPVIVGPINEVRAEHGLPPISRPFHEWMHSPHLTLGLFPEWFGHRQPDWPAQVQLTGFPLFDEKGLHEIPPAVDEFLSAGDPPIVFTPGSANFHAHDFFRDAVRACEILGRRGMLLSRDASQIPRDLPASVRYFPYVPFSEVLPRAAALVYHGGIGTLAQAARAGIPHLVMPLAHDQFDNAHRVKRLGIGESLPAPKFTAKRAAAKLRAILDSPRIAEHCARLAQTMAASDALAATCVALEGLGGKVPVAGAVPAS